MKRQVILIRNFIQSFKLSPLGLIDFNFEVFKKVCTTFRVFHVLTHTFTFLQGIEDVFKLGTKTKSAITQ
jgi:hypothetical protein